MSESFAGRGTPSGPQRSTFTDDDFKDIYPPGIELHYWSHARNQIVHRLSSGLVLPRETVLDVGCGTGVVTAFLRRQGVD
jgi:2-polyprenyl-3-methyl-5-hydroxy-6-metoxy-1,4-benzoquinol methylase